MWTRTTGIDRMLYKSCCAHLVANRFLLIVTIEKLCGRLLFHRNRLCGTLGDCLGEKRASTLARLVEHSALYWVQFASQKKPGNQ
jgi:hypothetical protein